MQQPLGERRNIALFRDDLGNEAMLFRDPKSINLAEEPAELWPALLRAEACLEEGFWIGGYISIEAGYLLDPALEHLLPSPMPCPLLALGVFDAPFSATELEMQEGPPPRLFNSCPQWSFVDYQVRFERLHRHLRKGDCYQGNLTFPIHAEWEG